MAIQIYDFRLSLIWMESYLDLLEPLGASQAPLSFLGRSYEYEAAFDTLLHDREATVGPDLTLPWLNIRHQGFWRHYFDGKAPPTARMCWQNLVPLRGTLPVTPPPSWLPGRIHVESYYYPHGTALVVTAVCTAALSPEEVVLMARRIRKTGKYTADWLPAQSKWVGLKTLADLALDMQRETALGPGTSLRARTVEPFTVLTVVQAEGVDFEPPPENGEVHRMLEAVTAWPNGWRSCPLPALDQVKLETGLVGAADVFYGRKRGRAIWFPEQFCDQGVDAHTLSCYHRNILLASMTVESLVALVKAANEVIERGMRLSPDEQSCARHAARILGQLYGGAASSYGTMSTNAQIDQNDYAPPIGQLRRYFNMYALEA
jgi:hypothetical protein